MAWGQTANVTQAYVNQQLGISIKQLFSVLENLNDFNTGWLASNGSAGLQSLGFTSGDASVIVSALADLANLRSVFYGTSYVASGGTVTTGTGHDFSAFLKQAIGLAPQL